MKKPIKGGVESTEDTAEALISELGNWAKKISHQPATG